MEALRLDPSNVIGLLNELEEQALVPRRRDPADGRRPLVGLSDEGAKALNIASRRLKQIEDELFASLDPAERKTLHALLSRVVGSASVVYREAERPPEDVA